MDEELARHLEGYNPPHQTTDDISAVSHDCITVYSGAPV